MKLLDYEFNNGNQLMEVFWSRVTPLMIFVMIANISGCGSRRMPKLEDVANSNSANSAVNSAAKEAANLRPKENSAAQIAANRIANIYTSKDDTLSKRRSKGDPLVLTGEIIAGRSVGNVFLNDSATDLDEIARKTFPKAYESDFPVSTLDFTNPEKYGLTCDRSINIRDTMPNPFKKGKGWHFYSKNDAIFMAKIDTFLCYANNGISSRDSKIGDVKTEYPQAEKYQLTGSRTKFTGSKDLRYLVEADQGIAFEFAYDDDDKTWNLYYIYIFEPNSEFRPLDFGVAEQFTKYVKIK